MGGGASGFTHDGHVLENLGQQLGPRQSKSEVLPTNPRGGGRGHLWSTSTSTLFWVINSPCQRGGLSRRYHSSISYMSNRGGGRGRGSSKGVARAQQTAQFLKDSLTLGETATVQTPKAPAVKQTQKKVTVVPQQTFDEYVATLDPPAKASGTAPSARQNWPTPGRGGSVHTAQSAGPSTRADYAAAAARPPLHTFKEASAASAAKRYDPSRDGVLKASLGRLTQYKNSVIYWLKRTRGHDPTLTQERLDDFVAAAKVRGVKGNPPTAPKSAAQFERAHSTFERLTQLFTTLEDFAVFRAAAGKEAADHLLNLALDHYIEVDQQKLTDPGDITRAFELRWARKEFSAYKKLASDEWASIKKRHVQEANAFRNATRPIMDRWFTEYKVLAPADTSLDAFLGEVPEGPPPAIGDGDNASTTSSDKEAFDLDRYFASEKERSELGATAALGDLGVAQQGNLIEEAYEEYLSMLQASIPPKTGCGKGGFTQEEEDTRR